MSDATEIEQRAARWLAKREGGAWSAQDQARLDAWVDESTAHRIAFLRLETVWGKAGRLRAAEFAAVVDSAPPARVAEVALKASGWRRRWLPVSAAAALVAAVAIPSYRQLVSAAQTFSTPVGGFQQLPLADGSRVDLNTNTALKVAFTDAERHVALTRGEAFFKVAKDHRRPFVVEAGRYRVIAVGTAFTVRLNGSAIGVVVTEGRVRVEDSRGAEQPAFVSAGQAAVVETERSIVRPAAVADRDAALGWRDGLLIFENRPLGEAAAEFNRYNKLQLIVDPSAAGIVIDGTFRATNVDAFVRLLRQGFAVRVVPGDDEMLLKRG